jgi:hypothetical protein
MLAPLEACRALELILDAAPDDVQAEALPAGRRSGRPSGLGPGHRDTALWRNDPGAVDPAAWRRQRPAFRGVGGKLVQRHGAGLRGPGREGRLPARQSARVRTRGRDRGELFFDQALQIRPGAKPNMASILEERTHLLVRKSCCQTPMPAISSACRNVRSLTCDRRSACAKYGHAPMGYLRFGIVELPLATCHILPQRPRTMALCRAILPPSGAGFLVDLICWPVWANVPKYGHPPGKMVKFFLEGEASIP